MRPQTRWGFLRELSFAPELEALYLEANRKGQRYRSLIACLLGAFIWMIFILQDIYRLGYSPRADAMPDVVRQLMLARLSFLGAVILAGLGVLKPTLIRFRQEIMVVLMMYLLALGSVTAIYCYQRLQLTQDSSVLMLVVMAMFLPLGQRFKVSLSLALGFVLTVIVFGALLVAEEFRRPMFELSLLLFMSTLVAAVGAYLLEYSDRQQFLLRRELEWHANHDSLTGLYNRRLFSHHLEVCIGQAHRDKHSLALVLIDVDHFKLYNDRYGHQAGDKALTALAGLLKSLAARPLDLAARVGGEELALVFFDVEARQAQELCQRLMRGVQALAIPHECSPTAPWMTVSAGCVMLGDERTEDVLYQHADKLLYQVKHNGRNGFALGLPNGMTASSSSGAVLS